VFSNPTDLLFWHVGHIVAVDSMKPTVFCISERGELLRFFDCASYMREPSDITVFGNEYYVCDFKVCNWLLIAELLIE